MGPCSTWGEESCAPYSIGTFGCRDSSRITPLARTFLWLSATATKSPNPLSSCLFTSGLGSWFGVPALAELSRVAHLCRKLTHYFLLSALPSNPPHGTPEKPNP